MDVYVPLVPLVDVYVPLVPLVLRVTEFPEPKVKLIREKVGLSQNRFALLIGVSKRTLENWEQGRRHPTGPAKALLAS